MGGHNAWHFSLRFTDGLLWFIGIHARITWKNAKIAWPNQRNAPTIAGTRPGEIISSQNLNRLFAILCGGRFFVSQNCFLGVSMRRRIWYNTQSVKGHLLCHGKHGNSRKNTNQKQSEVIMFFSLVFFREFPCLPWLKHMFFYFLSNKNCLLYMPTRINYPGRFFCDVVQYSVFSGIIKIIENVTLE